MRRNAGINIKLLITNFPENKNELLLKKLKEINKESKKNEKTPSNYLFLEIDNTIVKPGRANEKFLRIVELLFFHLDAAQSADKFSKESIDQCKLIRKAFFQYVNEFLKLAKNDQLKKEHSFRHNYVKKIINDHRLIKKIIRGAVDSSEKSENLAEYVRVYLHHIRYAIHSLKIDKKNSKSVREICAIVDTLIDAIPVKGGLTKQKLLIKLLTSIKELEAEIDNIYQLIKLDVKDQDLPIKQAYRRLEMTHFLVKKQRYLFKLIVNDIESGRDRKNLVDQLNEIDQFCCVKEWDLFPIIIKKDLLTLSENKQSRQYKNMASDIETNIIPIETQKAYEKWHETLAYLSDSHQQITEGVSFWSWGKDPQLTKIEEISRSIMKKMTRNFSKNAVDQDELHRICKAFYFSRKIGFDAKTFSLLRENYGELDSAHQLLLIKSLLELHPRNKRINQEIVKLFKICYFKASEEKASERIKLQVSLTDTQHLSFSSLLDLYNKSIWNENNFFSSTFIFFTDNIGKRYNASERYSMDSRVEAAENTLTEAIGDIALDCNLRKITESGLSTEEIGRCDKIVTALDAKSKNALDEFSKDDKVQKNLETLKVDRGSSPEELSENLEKRLLLPISNNDLDILKSLISEHKLLLNRKQSIRKIMDNPKLRVFYAKFIQFTAANFAASSVISTGKVQGFHANTSRAAAGISAAALGAKFIPIAGSAVGGVTEGIAMTVRLAGLSYQFKLSKRLSDMALSSKDFSFFAEELAMALLNDNGTDLLLGGQQQVLALKASSIETFARFASDRVMMFLLANGNSRTPYEINLMDPTFIKNFSEAMRRQDPAIKGEKLLKIKTLGERVWSTTLKTTGDPYCEKVSAKDWFKGQTCSYKDATEAEQLMSNNQAADQEEEQNSRGVYYQVQPTAPSKDSVMTATSIVPVVSANARKLKEVRAELEKLKQSLAAFNLLPEERKKSLLEEAAKKQVTGQEISRAAENSSSTEPEGEQVRIASTDSDQHADTPEISIPTSPAKDDDSGQYNELSPVFPIEGEAGMHVSSTVRRNSQPKEASPLSTSSQSESLAAIEVPYDLQKKIIYELASFIRKDIEFIEKSREFASKLEKVQDNLKGNNFPNDADRKKFDKFCKIFIDNFKNLSNPYTLESFNELKELQVPKIKFCEDKESYISARHGNAQSKEYQFIIGKNGEGEWESAQFNAEESTYTVLPLNDYNNQDRLNDDNKKNIKQQIEKLFITPHLEKINQYLTEINKIITQDENYKDNLIKMFNVIKESRFIVEFEKKFIKKICHRRDFNINVMYLSEYNNKKKNRIAGNTYVIVIEKKNKIYEFSLRYVGPDKKRQRLDLSESLTAFLQKFATENKIINLLNKTQDDKLKNFLVEIDIDRRTRKRDVFSAFFKQLVKSDTAKLLEYFYQEQERHKPAGIAGDNAEYEMKKPNPSRHLSVTLTFIFAGLVRACGNNQLGEETRQLVNTIHETLQCLTRQFDQREKYIYPQSGERRVYSYLSRGEHPIFSAPVLAAEKEKVVEPTAPLFDQ